MSGRRLLWFGGLSVVCSRSLFWVEVELEASLCASWVLCVLVGWCCSVMLLVVILSRLRVPMSSWASSVPRRACPWGMVRSVAESTEMIRSSATVAQKRSIPARVRVITLAAAAAGSISSGATLPLIPSISTMSPYSVDFRVVSLLWLSGSWCRSFLLGLSSSSLFLLFRGRGPGFVLSLLSVWLRLLCLVSLCPCSSGLLEWLSGVFCGVCWAEQCGCPVVGWVVVAAESACVVLSLWFSCPPAGELVGALLP